MVLTVESEIWLSKIWKGIAKTIETVGVVIHEFGIKGMNSCVIFIHLPISHLKISSHLYNESLRTRIILSLINKIFLFSECEVS